MKFPFCAKPSARTFHCSTLMPGGGGAWKADRDLVLLLTATQERGSLSIRPFSDGMMPRRTDHFHQLKKKALEGKGRPHHGTRIDDTYETRNGRDTVEIRSVVCSVATTKMTTVDTLYHVTSSRYLESRFQQHRSLAPHIHLRAC